MKFRGPSSEDEIAVGIYGAVERVNTRVIERIGMQANFFRNLLIGSNGKN